jgi:hypothetical protein
MPLTMPRALAVAAALSLASAEAAAQLLQEMAVITTPSFTQLTFGSGDGKRTVSQFALPVVVVLPFGERLSVDVSTAFATSSVTLGDSTTSEIAGLTDTQIRANFRLASDQVLLTAGLNIPTGQYGVPVDEQEAAGQIGNDFLYYPISSMGNGLAATAGVAYARPMGAWNVGVGASARVSTEFAAFEDDTDAEVRFTPADEYRLQLNTDRPVGDGAVSLGLTYSAFGSDLASGTTYSTGDRLIATAGWNFPWKGNDVFLSAWNLYRLEGEILTADAPAENVFNISGAVSIPVREYLVQPSVETRLWQVGGVRAGRLVNLGVRMRIPVGTLGLFPSVGYSIGTVFSTADGSGTDVSGLRASLTLRVN